MGVIDRGGYGRVQVDGRQHQAHRASYEAHKGPVPGGLPLDHLCRNRKCVNPDHLEPVTAAENNLRGVKARGLHGRCYKGHIKPSGSGTCRTCKNERKRAVTLRLRLSRERAKALAGIKPDPG